jgi:hypothetical protein
MEAEVKMRFYPPRAGARCRVGDDLDFDDNCQGDRISENETAVLTQAIL